VISRLVVTKAVRIGGLEGFPSGCSCTGVDVGHDFFFFSCLGEEYFLEERNTVVLAMKGRQWDHHSEEWRCLQVAKTK
jgi:hypothetical protein